VLLGFAIYYEFRFESGNKFIFFLSRNVLDINSFMMALRIFVLIIATYFEYGTFPIFTV
jgi:hypothetical protein